MNRFVNMNRFVKLGLFYAVIAACVGWMSCLIWAPKPWSLIIGLTPPVACLAILFSWLLVDVTKEILRG